MWLMAADNARIVHKCSVSKPDYLSELSFFLMSHAKIIKLGQCFKELFIK